MKCVWLFSFVVSIVERYAGVYFVVAKHEVLVAVLICCCNSRKCMWLLYFVVAIVERACGCSNLLLQ